MNSDARTPDHAPAAPSGRWLASALAGATLALAVVVVVVRLLDPGSGIEDLLFPVIGIAFAVVGWLIATRRPGHRVGWICLAAALAWMSLGASDAVGNWGFQARTLPRELAPWLGWLGLWLWVPALGLTGVHLPLRLPDGRLPSPRWRHYSRLCTVVLVLVAVTGATTPGPIEEIPGASNPAAVEWLDPVRNPVFLLLPPILVGALASLVVRHRRAGPDERRQIRCIAYGGAVFLAAWLSDMVLGVSRMLGLVSDGSPLVSAMTAVGAFGYAGIPVGIGVAVLRHRLYDIDLIVNRALVYSALTATLGLSYVGGVILLGQLFRPLTSGSDLAIAGSTLAVAALFRPARARIQTAVDRRFFRRRYDAARTLDSFSARLRDQVDLDAVGGELEAVVGETMQPAHVSLWLRTPRSR